MKSRRCDVSKSGCSCMSWGLAVAICKLQVWKAVNLYLTTTYIKKRSANHTHPLSEYTHLSLSTPTIVQCG